MVSVTCAHGKFTWHTNSWIKRTNNARFRAPCLLSVLSGTPRAGLEWAVVEAPWIPFSTLILTLYTYFEFTLLFWVLWILNVSEKHHPIWGRMKTLCGVTYSTWDCLDDIHILSSIFQCAHVVLNIQNALHSLQSFWFLQVSACGLHNFTMKTAKWLLFYFIQIWSRRFAANFSQNNCWSYVTMEVLIWHICWPWYRSLHTWYLMWSWHQPTEPYYSFGFYL